MKQTNLSKTTKIVAIAFMVATILGVFVISPSAQTDDIVIERGFYVFNEVLTFEYLTSEHEEYLDFSSGGLDCDTIYIVNPGFIEYWGLDGYTHVAYDGRWQSEDYRVIFVKEDAYSLTPEFVEWFNANTSRFSLDDVAVKKGMYKDIEQILTSTIYDADFNQLDSFQRMTITLLATVASVAVVALPLIVIFWIIKFLFSLFKYF